ncbi:MAG: HAD-IA family hydrolase [Gammaproteobacteria bacterium]|nr:HAD-IA family hydrolase [Gammaproteobacteria bacterium]
MKRLIVFDWDGTIVDSVSDIISCKQSLALKHGLPLPDEKIIREVLGKPFKEAMAICFPAESKEAQKLLENDYHKLMKKSFFYSPLFTNVLSTLIYLKSKGYILGVATSKYREEFDVDIKYHGLQDVFDIVACGDEHTGKPDPAMLKFIIKQTNVPIEDTLFIGDTRTDILFARNAGIDVITVTYGAHSKADLELANPDGFVDNFSEIVMRIDSYV